MVIVNARALLAAGNSCLSSVAPGTVRLDLAAVSEVDSSALGVLFAWMRNGAQRHIALRLHNPPASLISLATLYGVSELLPLA
ncbi:MAG: STAS domain-containing protein [Dokdonella sp.]|nr:MAG: STAS domain-containing protein [Dokdonella sp.]